MVGIIPTSVMLIALARPVVRGIYWSLTPEEATATAWVLAVMVASTVAYTIVTLQQQYCFATEQGGTNLWMQCLVTGLQVAFALVALSVPPSVGVVTICLGMVTGNTVLALVFTAYARRQMGGLNLRGVLSLYVRMLAASILAGVPAYFTASFIVWTMHDRLIAQYAADLAGAVVFVVFLLIGVRVFRVGEFQTFLDSILRRLHLKRG